MSASAAFEPIAGLRAEAPRDTRAPAPRLWGSLADVWLRRLEQQVELDRPRGSAGHAGSPPAGAHHERN